MGTVLTDDQIKSLFESHRGCGEAQEKTASELEKVNGRFDELVDLSGEIERLSQTQIQAAEARASQAAELRALEEKQRVDDEERTEREGARKTLALTAKILGPILALILLPLIGYGAKWFVSDYGHTRSEVVDQSHELTKIQDRAQLDRDASGDTTERAQENREAIRTIEGRLTGIEAGQGEILEELRSARRPRRR